MSHSPMISPISSRKSSSAGIHSTVLPIPIITDPSGRSTSTDDAIGMNHNLNHRHHHHRHSKLKRRRLSSSEKSIPPLGLKSYHLLYLSYILSIVLLGTLYSILTGSHLYNVYHSSTTSPSSSSSSIPNSSHYSYHYIPKKSTFYFANKKNPFNVYGVKLAWFWTSIFSLAQVVVLRTAATNPNLRNSNLKGKSKRQEEEEEDEEDQDEMDHDDDDEVDEYLARDSNSTRPQPNATSPVAMSVMRWFVATVLWASFSIYFFGPSLMERVLILTGGQCFPRSDSGMDLPGPIHGDFCRSRIPISPQSHPHAFRTANKALSDAHFAGGVTGRWQGGHDVSGHTFLLSFSILYLLEEISPFLPYFHKSLRPYYPKRMWSSFNPFIQSNLASTSSSNYSTQTSSSSTSTSSTSSTSLSRKEQLPNKTISSTIVFSIMALIALWSWMLLMTAVYFHSPLEKITGLLTGITFWWLLPKEA